MSPNPQRAVLIIPALNEEAVIGQMLARVPAGLFASVLVVDNGSSDRTAEIARLHGADVVSEPARGYGNACLRALSSLPERTEILVFMQADLSEDPSEARRLIAPIQADQADLVIGTRTQGTAQPGSLLVHQRFGNWLATSMIRLLYARRYTDLGAFRAIRRDALAGLKMHSGRYAWTVEMQVRAIEQRLRVVEIPVSYRPRFAGENKISGRLGASFAAGATILSTICRLWWRYRFCPGPV